MKGSEHLIIWAVAEARRRRRLSPPPRTNDLRGTVSVPFSETIRQGHDVDRGTTAVPTFARELTPGQKGIVIEWQ